MNDFDNVHASGLKMLKAIAAPGVAEVKNLLLVMRPTERLPPASRPRRRQKVLLVSSRLHFGNRCRRMTTVA